MEETLTYKFSPYRKFEFSCQITERQTFVLVFVTLAQLTPSDSKTEKDSSEKGKHKVTRKKESNLLYGVNLYIFIRKSFLPQATFTAMF